MPEKQVNLKSFKSTFKLVGQNAKIHFSESQQIFLLNLLKKDKLNLCSLRNNSEPFEESLKNFIWSRFIIMVDKLNLTHAKFPQESDLATLRQG